MSKRKLIIAQNIEKELQDQVENLVPDWEVIVGKEKETWQRHIQSAEIIAGWKKDMNESLKAESNLRWVQSWSAGVDSHPLDRFAERNVALTSANGVHAYPISETIFALMLGLTRKIHAYVRNQQSKTWAHEQLKLEIHRKTAGIIGMGAIGKETAKIAKAFGMKVIGVRHSQKPEEFVDEMVTTERLNDVLPSCDYVIVTVPLTSETRHLFGKEQFHSMKPSSFFINIGRGEVVDEPALMEALKTEKIAGAGLDVFEKEPLPEDSPLWELENVILTPHSAGSTEHYDKRVIEDIFIPNLKEYLKGAAPSINLVDYDKGY
ncbi:D-2-hydroxyacid dehydrogenase [Sediminibacillus dalangtanensis]|uniref:D-2-hydroxyacid dehydrogenase n=1 Tax=Sediminibacillus dalangtanensis TaxID=2729421 RepID=A0ABX7VS13_9BACI|nr:D-2-hydroxyacid dehydrogenase [Sediminibacillus dalangtanensis]QTM98360.1 D-2-hydroxyacid dehydrogenase [Sediminibacillus dalangtanensis]